MKSISETMAEAIRTNSEGTDSEELRSLNYEQELNRLSRWLYGILKRDLCAALPEEVKSVYFGMLQSGETAGEGSVHIFVAGSKHASVEDWAGEAEYWSTEQVFHSGILTAVYRIEGLEKGRVLGLSFLTSVVEIWCGSAMGLQLRGPDQSRKVFVCPSKHRAVPVTTLYDEQTVFGRGSSAMTWRGRFDGKAQGELLPYLREVANLHHARWNDVEPRQLEGWDALSMLKGNRPAPADQPSVQWFEGEITGRVMIRLDLVDLDQRDALVSSASSRGIQILDWSESEYDFDEPLLCLDHLSVNGVIFQLFDPRRLFPMEDRIGFIFLESDILPELNGRVATIRYSPLLWSSSSLVLQTADWLVEGAWVCFRRHHENWFFGFLAWIRFFFLDSFRTGLDSQEKLMEGQFQQFRNMVNQIGSEAARDLIFERLTLEFELEADRCTALYLF